MGYTFILNPTWVINIYLCDLQSCLNISYKMFGWKILFLKSDIWKNIEKGLEIG